MGKKKKKEETVLAKIGEGQYPVLSGAAQGGDISRVIEKNLGDGAGDATAFDLPRIQIPTGGGGDWTLPGGESPKVLEGIIVAWQDVRAYWPDEEPMGEPPQCQSPDGRTGYGEPGGKCKQCPLAEYETAANGAGQACKAMKRLFLLLPEDLLPTLLTLPPTSLKPCREYFMRLIQKGVAYDALATKISLDSAKTDGGISYSKAEFEAGNTLTKEQAEAVEKYRQSIKNLLETRVTAADYGKADEGEEL